MLLVNLSSFSQRIPKLFFNLRTHMLVLSLSPSWNGGRCKQSTTLRVICKRFPTPRSRSRESDASGKPTAIGPHWFFFKCFFFPFSLQPSGFPFTAFSPTYIMLQTVVQT